MFSSITTAVTNSAWSLGGLVASAAVTYATQDSPGPRFAGGIVMTITGISSFIIQLTSDAPKAPAADKTRKIDTMTASALLAAGGLYNVITGLLGLTKQANIPKYDPVLYGKLVEQFRNCSLANKLWESSGYFEIKPWNTTLPAVNSISRVIKLPNTSPDTNLGNLANMLCHLRPQYKGPARAIERGVRAMKIDCKTFEEMMVKLSWYPNRCAHDVAKNCIATAEWPNGSDLFACKLTGPDAPWATAEKLYRNYKCDPANSEHSEYLFQQWAEILRSNRTNRMITDAFCASREAVKDATCSPS